MTTPPITHNRPAPLGPAWRLAAAILPVAMAGAIGSRVTLPNIPGWYAGLAKPPFTPPNAAFGPAWTLLYGLMAYAVWRILALPSDTPGRSGALTAFFVQLALNALWSCAFFGLHDPALGLAVIAALIVALGVTVRTFRPLDRRAAWLLVPYLAWVLFAAYLNAGVWRLNA